MDKAGAYRRAYERILDVVDDSVADVDVPATPGWTVKDVIAHLAGFLSAYRQGGHDAFGPGWGDEQVEIRRDKSLQQVLHEWSDLVEEPGDLFESGFSAVAVSDILAHEQDIRSALDRPGGRDDENIVPSAEMAIAWVERAASKAELPPLRIVTEDFDRQIGDGEPATTLRASTFDLYRTLHGRRTVDQVRAMDWDGDPEPWLEVLFIFGPTKELVEA
jgi:uncharacterized protein (TIGR03083 family)